MNFAGAVSSVRFRKKLAVCPQCESTLQIGRGLCLNCLLSRGVAAATEETESLEVVLDSIDVRDADWRLGNYQILEEIGRGGMGVIYRARQRHSRRIVALKRILAYHADSPETLSRFRREAEAAASLDHANILPIYEVSESEDGLPFFSMKFAGGGSLLENESLFTNDPRRSVAIVAKVCRAVQHAHRQGILHRDLKPGNILLDGSGEPLVSDFGLAKWLDQSTDLTRTLTVFGTPGYIAPEQALGPATDLKPTADIYSLGAILFDLLAGRPPFLGEHALAVIRQATDKPAPKLRSIVPRVDRDLETICARCLEREPNARYSSAGDVAEDLERWLEGRTIVARPVSPAVRIWRWTRRNRKLSISVGTCLLFAAIAVGWLSENRTLSARLQQQQVALHSIAVLPFLNLETGNADFDSARIFTEKLQTRLRAIGPARVTSTSQLPPNWIGAGGSKEVRAMAERTGCRSVMWGTRRSTPAGERFSIHFVNGDSHVILQPWIIETQGRQLPNEAQFKEIESALYRGLDRSDAVAPSNVSSEQAENEQARLFMTKGQELLYRRNIPDMERAIICFEGAIKADPKSIAARCYLVFALMGRDLLSTTPELSDRALRAAYDAVKLAPDNPTANRAVCAIATSIGNYSEALEYGFRALESGDQSERAFGEIGYIWKMTGHPDRALPWFEKVRLTSRQPAECDGLVGDCWAELKQDQRARQAYESAATFLPDQADGWIGLCRLRMLAKDYDGARQICRRESPKYPQSQEARRMAALIEFFARNIPDAQKQYRELASDDAFGGTKGGFYGAVDYQSALACLKILSGHREEALSALQTCLAAEEKHLADVPNDPTSRYRKAAIESMLGQRDNALADLRLAFDAGWIDYRSTEADPRFDAIANTAEYRRLISETARKVEILSNKTVTPK
jgi:tetratricopeptide (TPR) repeat protein/tRNA A-37 threonylcarbamoyl transferase component Bud32